MEMGELEAISKLLHPKARSLQLGGLIKGSQIREAWEMFLSSMGAAPWLQISTEV